MSDILDMTLASLAEALKEKKISAAEAAGACLDRMEATEPRLCAMLHVDREGALAQAKARHDALERFYIDAMNYDRLEEIKAALMNALP